MKRLIITILLSTAALLCLFRPAHAIPVTVGPVVWYAWWNPAFEGELRYENGSFTIPFNMRFTMDPTFLYGPMLSVGGDNWNLSCVFLTGVYNARSNGTVAFINALSYPMDEYASQNIRKYDIDSTLSYSLTPLIRVFLGFKYQRYTWSVGSNLLGGGTSFLRLIGDDTINSYGGGLGVSFNIHLFDNLFLVWNISALYQYNYLQVDEKLIIAGTNIIPVPHNYQANALGGNSTTSLAYLFDSIGTTLTFGFRYQYVRLLNTTGDKLWSRRDQFYGIFFSAGYSLDL